MGKRGTTFCENAEPVSTISTPYERGTRFTVQVGFERAEAFAAVLARDLYRCALAHAAMAKEMATAFR